MKRPVSLVGRAVDGLTLSEQLILKGKWIALERYDPVRQPFRVIEAMGRTSGECIRALQDRGLDSGQFELHLFSSGLVD